MLYKPKFNSLYRVEIVEPEGVFLLSERQSFLLGDSLSQLLSRLMDGNHSAEDIIDQILPNLVQENPSAEKLASARSIIYYTLMQMEQKGYIVENENPLPPELIVFCDRINLNSQEAHHRLKTIKVAIQSFDSIVKSEFIAILESLHIQVADEGDIEVILTDDYLQNNLDACNQRALQSKHPWMLVKPVGTIVAIGPLFYPDKTACWECLAQRLRHNRPIETFIEKRKDIKYPIIPPLSSFPATRQTALGMAATELFKWIVRGENKQLEKMLITHDTFSLNTQNHILVKRPQCPCCGQSELNQTPLPIILENRQKTFTSDGGHRCVPPEVTLEKYQHHISPITGVVRELKPLPQFSNKLTRTYIATHHFATMFDNLETLKQNIRGRSAGKGKSDNQAKASAFCEAVERYSGVFQGDEIRKKSSYQVMGDKAIHPNACMNFSQAQYQNRQDWNARYSSLFQKIPEPFDETREIEWTPVWSLTHQEFKYLPTAYCYYGYPQNHNPDCWADTNGCAAGNTLEEAILQGFMELVERDSIALWWYNRIQRPGVDLESFDEPYFQILKDYYQTIHREIWVLDITNDLNISAFAAMSRRSDREIEDIIFGFGAHFDPAIAILRALTEINQSLPAVFSSDTNSDTRYPSSASQLLVNWWKNATIENQPYLLPDKNIVAKVRTDYAQIWSDNLLEDVMTCQRIVEQKGMEMLVLDQTRPDIGLNVVKAIVPGMRHFWKRLGTGRLYDVPVQLGWLKEPLEENQLNPFPIEM